MLPTIRLIFSSFFKIEDLTTEILQKWGLKLDTKKGTEILTYLVVLELQFPILLGGVLMVL